MATATKEIKRYYTYEIYDKNNQLVYVGKGTRSRFLQHFNRPEINHIEYFVKVKIWNSEDEALYQEAKLIYEKRPKWNKKIPRFNGAVDEDQPIRIEDYKKEIQMWPPYKDVHVPSASISGDALRLQRNEWQHKIIRQNRLAVKVQNDSRLTQQSKQNLLDYIAKTKKEIRYCRNMLEDKINDFRRQSFDYINFIESGGHPKWMGREVDCIIHNNAPPPIKRLYSVRLMLHRKYNGNITDQLRYLKDNKTLRRKHARNTSSRPVAR